MKIFIAQQNYIIGDFAYNSRKIISAIHEAKQKDGDLIIFSELSLCGYIPMDLLNFDDFIQECLGYIELIKKETTGIAVLLGAPTPNSVLEGKDLYNSAYFLEDGSIKQIVHKSLLPTYDIFDEYRYFEPASEWHCINFKGKKLAVTICEDIWDLVADPLYKSPPMDHLIKEEPDIIINLSASPFSYTHAAQRLATAQKNVTRYGLPIIYCTTVGAQAENIFDGGSFTLDSSGKQIQQLPFFKEALAEVHWQHSGILEAQSHKEIAPLPKPAINPEHLIPDLNIDKIHDALVFGIREYFSKMGFTKAVIASSGGIDSAVSLYLACKALGAENVQSLLMPSGFSTAHSIEDAEKLSKNLSNPYEILPIQPAFEVVQDSLSPVFKDLPFDLAEENVQARLRGLLAMAFSNKFSHILLNTSNKSELAVGYGTLYGDLAGGLSIIGDLYKTQVYALARYINKQSEIIPKNILSKAPSAELRPDQKDSDSLPDYEVMDKILYRYLECKHRKSTLIRDGFPEEIVLKVLKMVNKNEYKRTQFCPILRVSSKAFGSGRRMPIVARYEG